MAWDKFPMTHVGQLFKAHMLVVKENLALSLHELRSKAISLSSCRIKSLSQNCYGTYKCATWRYLHERKCKT